MLSIVDAPRIKEALKLKTHCECKGYNSRNQGLPRLDVCYDPSSPISYLAPTNDYLVEAVICEKDGDGEQVIKDALAWMKREKVFTVDVYYRRSKPKTYEQAKKVEKIVKQILGNQKIRMMCGINKDCSVEMKSFEELFL